MRRVTVINFLRCDVNKLKFTILFSFLFPGKCSCIVKVWQQALDALVDLINEDSIDLLDLGSALPNLESWSWAQLHLLCKSLWQFSFTHLIEINSINRRNKINKGKIISKSYLLAY